MVDVPAPLEIMPLVECDVISSWESKLVEDELVATHVDSSRLEDRSSFRRLLVTSTEVSEVVVVVIILG